MARFSKMLVAAVAAVAVAGMASTASASSVRLPAALLEVSGPGTALKLMRESGEGLAEFFAKKAGTAGADDAIQGLLQLNKQTDEILQSAVAKMAANGVEGGWDVLLAALRQTDARLPQGTDTVVKTVMAKVQQMRASALLKGDAVAVRELTQSVSAKEREFMQLYAKRQLDVGGVTWHAADGRIMSVAENTAANALMTKVKTVQTSSDLSMEDMRQIRDAIAAGREGTLFQRRLADTAFEHNLFSRSTLSDASKSVDTGLATKADDTADAATAAAANKADDLTADAAAKKSLADDTAADAAADSATPPPKAAATSAYKATGAMFDDSTELALRTALSQSRFEGGSKLMSLPADAEGIFAVATQDLLARAKELLEGGGRVGRDLKDVAAAIKTKSPAARSEAEQGLLTAWNKRFEHGGAFMTPSGLMMGAEESAQALRLLNKLKAYAKDMPKWKDYKVGGFTPIDLRRGFTETERAWLEQASRQRFKSSFLDEVRQLSHPKMLDAANGYTNPFPTVADIEAVTPVLADRLNWQNAMLGKTDSAERIARMNGEQLGGKNAYMITDRAAEAREGVRSTITSDIKNNPTADRWAKNLDPYQSNIETLNPLPSKADVAFYSQKWTERVNSLEDRLRAARNKLATEMNEYYKFEAQAHRSLLNAEELAGKRLQSATNNPWSSSYSGARADVQQLENQLAQVRAISPEQYATRFPAVGQMDDFIAGVKKSIEATAEEARAAAEEAAKAGTAFADSIRRIKMQMQARVGDRWTNPATGRLEEPAALVQTAQARVEKLVAELETLAKQADASTRPRIGVPGISAKDPLGARHAGEVAVARADEVRRLKKELEAATADTDLLGRVKAFNEHRVSFLKDSEASLGSIRAELRERLNEIRRQKPALEHQVGQLKRLPNEAEALAAAQARLATLEKHEAAIRKAGSDLDGRISKDDFGTGVEYKDIKNKMSWVDKIYADLKKVIEVTEP